VNAAAPDQDHADARGHLVFVNNDGYVTKVKAKIGYQIPLIDDLLLP